MQNSQVDARLEAKPSIQSTGQVSLIEFTGYLIEDHAIGAHEERHWCGGDSQLAGEISVPVEHEVIRDAVTVREASRYGR